MPPRVQQGHLQDLYRSMHSAHHTCRPEHASHWPPNYTAAFSQSQDNLQQLHFSTLDIPGSLLPQFTENLHTQLDLYPDFDGFFFVHEYRGLKGVTCHDGCTAQEVHEAYDVLVEDLNPDLIDINDWWVDIGLEISSPEKVLQWAEEAHGILIEHLLPHLDRRRAVALMRSPAWATDTSSLLYDLAGFRVKPGSYGTPAQVRYINVYTTDKTPTYQLHTGAFKRHRPIEILPDTMPVLLSDIRRLAQMHRYCGYNTTGSQEGCVRVEIRVPLSAAHERLRVFPLALAEDSIIAIDAMVWWSVTVQLIPPCFSSADIQSTREFKYIRTAALHYVLKQFNIAPPVQGIQVQCLRLAAISVWMWNGLVYRLGDDRSWDRLLFRTCALQGPPDPDDSEEEEEEEQEEQEEQEDRLTRAHKRLNLRL